MTSYVFMCALQFAWMCHLSSGEFLQDANAFYGYGLPELTRYILERIRHATGQPIETNRFIPILAASSKDYEIIDYEPYKKTTKYHRLSKNNRLEGGRYFFNEGDEISGHERDHFYELGENDKFGNELFKHVYDDESGEQDKYTEERYYKKNHHRGGEGNKGSKSKKGRKHGKFHVEKGFRDIYHKDEENKSDFYWSNQHEEGKWIEYGFRNQKSKKGNRKSSKGKKEKSKTEESSYEKEGEKMH